MFGIPPVPYPDSRWAMPVGLAIFLAVVGLAFFSGVDNELERADARERALNAWMADCPHAMDQCALSWDVSYTLRDIYIKRVSGP